MDTVSNSVMLNYVQRLPRITAGYEITFCNTPQLAVTVTINLSTAGNNYLTHTHAHAPCTHTHHAHTRTTHAHTHTTHARTETNKQKKTSQFLHLTITDMTTLRNSEMTSVKFLDFPTLKMAALCPFETSVTVYQSARRNIPGGLSLKQQLCDNLKFCQFLTSRTSRLIRLLKWLRPTL